MASSRSLAEIQDFDVGVFAHMASQLVKWVHRGGPWQALGHVFGVDEIFVRDQYQ